MLLKHTWLKYLYQQVTKPHILIPKQPSVYIYILIKSAIA